LNSADVGIIRVCYGTLHYIYYCCCAAAATTTTTTTLLYGHNTVHYLTQTARALCVPDVLLGNSIVSHLYCDNLLFCVGISGGGENTLLYIWAK
jgi:hypothetical protein